LFDVDDGALGETLGTVVIKLAENHRVVDGTYRFRDFQGEIDVRVFVCPIAEIMSFQDWKAEMHAKAEAAASQSDVVNEANRALEMSRARLQEFRNRVAAAEQAAATAEAEEAEVLGRLRSHEKGLASLEAGKNKRIAELEHLVATRKEETLIAEVTGGPLLMDPTRIYRLLTRIGDQAVEVEPGLTFLRSVSRDDGDDQRFNFVWDPVRQGYEIRWAGKNKTVDVPGFSRDSNLAVCLWDINGGFNQAFHFFPVADDPGFFFIFPRHSFLALTKTGGQIKQCTFSGELDQR
jgi:hypothetical protein